MRNLGTSSFWINFVVEARCSSSTMPPARGTMVSENADFWLKSRSMGESRRRRGTQGVGVIKKRAQVVCHSKLDVVKK